MRTLAAGLPHEADRRALTMRANSLVCGYSDEMLATLAGIDEEVALVVGKISTWFGKHLGGLPSAFGCVCDEAGRAAVALAMQQCDSVARYLRGLHAGLRFGSVPSFAATRLFFMAGEANRHPKHIAYFLPEDEGVKRSPFKRTYYFANTHRALLERISLPLARSYLDLGAAIPGSADELEAIPTLGVLAHEMGHFVHREGASFAALNGADRWVSVLMQETAADVFGTLILAEVLAPVFGFTPAQAILYHLAECLRYVDRGLGCFPDSDGMYLQLNYLAMFGALRVESGEDPRLQADPEVVLAGFRSLARVFADTLLSGEAEGALALHRRFGPANTTWLQPLIDSLRRNPQKSIEYLQEPASPGLKKTAPPIRPSTHIHPR
jgi:hypothetical protein